MSETTSQHPMSEKLPRVSTVRLCGAKGRNGPCRARAMLNSDRCYHHGGKSKKGVAAGQFKTGRYSRYMPVQLAAKYEQILADPDWANLQDEIALITTRMAELLDGMTKGDAPSALWKEAGQRLHAFKIARSAGDVIAMGTNLSEMESLIGKGIAVALTWDEIRAIAQDKRKLVAEERKRLVEMQQVLSVEQANVLVASVIGIITEEVNDPALKAQIGTRLMGLVNVRGIREQSNGTG